MAENDDQRDEGARLHLRADCAHCFALCCVAPAFAVSADFAINKKAECACPHLQANFRCDMHASLRQRGFRGCTVYDCFGAGQKVSQLTFGGQDWQQNPRLTKQMFGIFPIMRDLHELLWYLTEALTLQAVRPLYAELRGVLTKTERLTHDSPEALLELDMVAYRQEINALLLRASELARDGVQRKKRDLRGANLVGAKFKGVDLVGASLRGACLIGADLGNAKLNMADFTGADLRAADLRGADLRGSIFLSQSQVDAAQGDLATKLPPSLNRPAHWE